jgi:predicted RNA-binding Zn ribbon-like protein
MDKVREGRNSAKSDWREGFLFLGNNLTLDFINTRPAPDGEPQELLSDWRSLLRWFQAAELIDAGEAANLERRWARSGEAVRTLKAMRNFRESLRKEVLRWESGAPVRTAMRLEINNLLSRHPMLTRISLMHGQVAVTRWFRVKEPSDLFAPLAYSAATFFSQTNRKRVRQCQHCILHFHDTSKIGTRRWCSMRLCGNRTKVAAYANRQRADP